MKRIIFYAVALTVITLLGAKLFSISRFRCGLTSESVTAGEIRSIAGAVSQYNLSFEIFPKNEKEIFGALTGCNRFGTVFFSTRRTNETGAPLDSWMTPYRINVVEKNNFQIISAGPNKNFGDQDDIIYNSSSNGFAR